MSEIDRLESRVGEFSSKADFWNNGVLLFLVMTASAFMLEQFTKGNAMPGMLVGPEWNVDKVGLIRVHIGAKP